MRMFDRSGAAATTARRGFSIMSNLISVILGPGQARPGQNNTTGHWLSHCTYAAHHANHHPSIIAPPPPPSHAGVGVSIARNRTPGQRPNRQSGGFGDPSINRATPRYTHTNT
uniref:Putative secreted protein n=1 Tax=Anopheles marajoara TaxID=58244 RepID=A0A2M4C8S1_9DIPT